MKLLSKKSYLAYWLFVIIVTQCMLLACGDASPTTIPTPTPAATLVTKASPPTQPTSGPGGSSYNFGGVVSNSYGEAEKKYYIFEPSKPQPKSAPLILLLHGYIDVDPIKYQAWIEHLVRRGNIIIYPVYQASAVQSDGTQFTDSAVEAITAGLVELKQATHVQPELDKVIVVGYSAGGVIAANITARAAKVGLPVPKALFTITPGGCSNCSSLSIRNFLLETDALSAISPATKMLVLIGDRDIVVGDTGAKLIWKSVEQIPAANRDYLLISSDTYGSPALIADHGMTNRRTPDAYNYYGIWKLTDALQSCALKNQDCEYALGDKPQQRFLGKWSDGTPVKELTVIKK
jgi:dienelactone hydrolase